MSQSAEHYAITVRRVSIEGEEFWRATVRELPDVAEFAETREEAIDLILDSIETLKQAAKEEGIEFPEPLEEEDEYSGRVTLRLPKSLHREISMRAQLEDVSLNTFILAALAKCSTSQPSQVGVAGGLWSSEFSMRGAYGSAGYGVYFAPHSYSVGMAGASYGLPEMSMESMMAQIEAGSVVVQGSTGVAGNFIYPMEEEHDETPHLAALLHIQHHRDRKVRSRA